MAWCKSFPVSSERPNNVADTSVAQTMGITVVCLLFVQVLLGGGSVWFNGRAFGGNPRAKLVWKYHRYVGFHFAFSSSAELARIQLSGYPVTSSFRSIYSPLTWALPGRTGPWNIVYFL